LAKQITRYSHTDSEKAEAIFYWIATHISYDTELRLNTSLQKKIYTSETNVVNHVLKRKKALCGGYAFLFQKLCLEVGIQSEVIHGFTKKYNTQPTSRSQPDHTWNAVKLADGWHLLDITWAVSHGSTNKPKMFWYTTKPSDFIKSHYPKEPKWTLLPNAISLEAFQNPSKVTK
jgi:transglutaminase/protease-like cytokinesis protein 3